MVPGSGKSSNSESQLLAEWKKNNKAVAGDLESQADLEEFFETLAEWNEFLENHVPYFQEPEL